MECDGFTQVITVVASNIALIIVMSTTTMVISNFRDKKAKQDEPPTP